MFKQLKLMAGLVITATVAACSTAAYRQSVNECKPEALKQYPVQNVTEMVERLKPITIPTGTMTCTSNRIGDQTLTNCTQGTRIDFIPYTAQEVRDTNSAARDAAVRSCARRVCQARFGNAKCE